MADQQNTGGFKIESLQETIKDAEQLVIEKLSSIKEKSADKIDIGDLFDMQWMMNKFSQLTEMSSAVLAGAHQAISAMNRNIK
ncbi:MAG: DUF5407 family protein [Chlamydiota bacterium]|nr:DUF5407 family protein [Chlamydiota bacterium]